MKEFGRQLVLLLIASSLVLGNWQSRVVSNGVVIEASIEPAAGHNAALSQGSNVTIRFRLADATGPTPLGGAHPAAWLALRRPDTPASCGDLVQQLLGGGIFRRAETDLNDYYVLALNDDASIHVVDPLFGYGNSKLLAMIKLKSPGADWAITPDQNRLFVSMPAANQIAVVDTANWKVIRWLDTGANPGRVAIQPDGEYVWISTAAGVDVFSTGALARVGRFPDNRAGAGIAFDPDSRYAILADDSVLVADVAKLAKVRELSTGRGAASIAYSSLSRFAYVANRADGAITAIDPARDQPAAAMRAEPGLSQIRIAPGGRLGFALNPERKLLHIFDTTTNRIVQTAEIPGGPEQVAFSEKLAYIVQRDSDVVLMIPLDAVGTSGARVPSMDFPGGQHPFGEAPLPGRLVEVPGEAAVLLANPADGVIYYYEEGMAAPKGNFSNYSRQPRAVLVVDRSLKERRTGEYEATAQLGRPGRYTLAVVVDSPRVAQCFEDIDVAPLQQSQKTRPPVTLEPLGPAQPVYAGQTVRLRFRVFDTVSKLPTFGIQDIAILTYLASGARPVRAWATAEPDGVYGVDFTPEESGVYVFAASSNSLGLSSGAAPSGQFEVFKKGDR